MDENKIRVLYFVDRMLKGGIQSLIIDWVSKFDKSKIQVDFLLLDDGNDYELEQMLLDLGCNIYKLKGIWINTPLDYIKYRKAMNNFFKEHNNYKVVHLHSSSKNYLVLKYAKKYNIPVRIAHSHNIDFQTKNRLKKYIGNLFKKFLIRYATDYFACSIIAGKWLFGDKIIDSSKFKIINNAIDYNKYKFNMERRNEIRKQLEVQDSCTLIGHVGRFTEQKNHTFLIDIFNEIHKKQKKCKLLLVGIGEKEDEIKKKVKKLELENFVIFSGFKENVNEYLWAMDVFVFPSKFEGLGLALIEAQATGMMCFTSKNVVPQEAKVSESLKYISLEEDAIIWAEKINNIDLTRKNNYISIKENGYIIDDVVNSLKEFYINS